MFVALGLAIVGCSPVEKPPRNLLLISLDTLAPAHMSAYGNERRTTPAIDSLLDESLRFDNAFSSSSWTLPAHASMLTGLYPKSLADDPNSFDLYKAAPMLAELFKRKGYRTAAFTGGGYVGGAFGVQRGFQQFEGSVTLTTEATVEWLDAHSEETFFLFFHTYTAHIAYTDRRYVEPGAGGRIADIFSTFIGPSYRAVCCEGMVPTPDEQEFLTALYDGGVAAADEMVGDLISTLTRLGLRDLTTVIITSDHGEEFWQHTGRAAQHGHTLYDELLRIPLIWFEVGLPTAGTASEAAVSLIDLVPTLVARFDLARPAATDGVDLSPILDGESWQPERPLFAEGVLNGPARYGIRTAEGKLVWTPQPNEQLGIGKKFPVPVRDRVELYLPGDTGEQRNVADLHPELRDELMSKLRGHLDKPGVAGPNAGHEPLSDEVREQLRALGYVDEP